jgi:hypothetical protein
MSLFVLFWTVFILGAVTAVVGRLVVKRSVPEAVPQTNVDSSDQPIPIVTSDDVDRIIRRDFSAEQFVAVKNVLKEYGHEKWHYECCRVQLAALKLSQGRMDVLQTNIDLAKQDFRDVLAPAEYPNYSRVVFRIVKDKVSPTDERKIIEEDWTQYQHWLRR